MVAFAFRHAWLFKWLLNAWPPFFFSGIRIRDISADYRSARVDLLWRPWTRNINNSQFGGSLFAMTDPIFALLLYGSLGIERYVIWDKSADIDFISPGIGRLTAEFHMDDADVQRIKQATEQGAPYFPEFEIHIKDQSGQLVSTLKRRLYVRLRPQYRP